MGNTHIRPTWLLVYIWNSSLGTFISDRRNNCCTCGLVYHLLSLFVFALVGFFRPSTRGPGAPSKNDASTSSTGLSSALPSTGDSHSGGRVDSNSRQSCREVSIEDQGEGKIFQLQSTENRSTGKTEERNTPSPMSSIPAASSEWL